jgi:glycosyltransferase involved in cell wall biosynthesis
LASKVCFLGSTRYGRPLNATNAKKFRTIKSLGEVFVIGFSDNGKPRIFTEQAKFYLLPQLPMPLLRYVEFFIIGQLLLVWLIVRHHIQVVVAQSPYEGFVAALAVKFAAWFGYKVRLAVEVHGDFEKSVFLYRRIRFQGLYRFLMKQASLYSLARADVLRAVSLSTTNQLKRWVSETTVVQFPAWTDIETFYEAGGTKINDTCSIVYAGVLSPVKGIHYLISAFSALAKQFPSARLFVIGKDENKAYAAALVEQVKELGLTERVQFIGPLPQSELAIWMARASVLVLPSISEGLPRVIIEAMATGTPVIGSKVGGIPELIEDGVRGFLVPPGDAKTLAEKLRWVLSNVDKASDMGMFARAFVETSFSTERYLNGYKQIFETVQSGIEHTEHAASPL